MPSFMKLIVAVILTVGIGSLGGIFTATEVNTWYAGIQKPSFNPPSWVFAPVWTLLYLLMGVSVYLVWKQPLSTARRAATGVFIVQFVFNFLWSFIFFKLHLIGWALAEIIVMWVLILITIGQFARLSRTAAWLLVPYLAWVSFATVLTAAIYRLNT